MVLSRFHIHFLSLHQHQNVFSLVLSFRQSFLKLEVRRGYVPALMSYHVGVVEMVTEQLQIVYIKEISVHSLHIYGYSRAKTLDIKYGGKKRQIYPEL